MALKIFGEEELANLREVIESGSLWRGPKGNFVVSFEEAIGERFNRRYVHAVNSGTSANEASVKGLGLEIGDEVICPATVPIFASLPVFAAGCIPVFCDVDPRTLIISPEGIEGAITERAKAVLVVHLWGQPAPMDGILRVARKHNLKIIEDCAQAYDSFYKGRRVGSFGDVMCSSLQQSKHITSGEGGFIATDDEEIHKLAELYSNVGMPWFRYGLESLTSEPVGGVPTRGHFSMGHGHRLTELQGAVALAQLGKIEKFNAARKVLVEIIEEELRDCPGLLLAYRYPDTETSYWNYPVQLNPEETSLAATEVAKLCYEGQGIEQACYSEVNYLENVYQELESRRQTPYGLALPEYVHYEPGMCPKAEDGAKRTISLPTHHSTDPETLRRQVQALRRTMERHA